MEANEAVIGAKATTLSSATIEVYGDLDLDFVWLDFETAGRSPYDSDLLADVARTTETAGIDPIVRLPSCDPVLIGRTLDAGIRTILIPQIRTPADVRKAVAASRFAYQEESGRRSATVGRASVWGKRRKEFLEEEDENVLIGVTLENEAALENVEAITSVSGLGFAFIGKGDLSISLGHAMDTCHPTVKQAISTMKNTCLANDVPLGQYSRDTEDAVEAFSDGYQLLLIGDDVASARQVIGERADHLREFLS